MQKLWLRIKWYAPQLLHFLLRRQFCLEVFMFIFWCYGVYRCRDSPCHQRGIWMWIWASSSEHLHPCKSVILCESNFHSADMVIAYACVLLSSVDGAWIVTEKCDEQHIIRIQSVSGLVVGVVVTHVQSPLLLSCGKLWYMTGAIEWRTTVCNLANRVSCMQHS